MNHFEIPGDLAQFITEKIHSVAQLEALLLLRADPQRSWTVYLVARRLYISETEAENVLAHLRSENLLNLQPGESTSYSYGPQSIEVSEMTDRLADTYAKHLVPVTNLIHSQLKNKVQQFADAFRLRKEER